MTTTTTSTPTNTDIYAAQVRAELLRRKLSAKEVSPSEFDLGIGNYYLMRVGVVEEDLDIEVSEFVDLLESSLKKYLAVLHEKELEASEITIESMDLPDVDIDVRPRTIRDHIYREFLSARAAKLKEVKTS